MRHSNLFWKFRIYPENKSLYFLVWIFQRKKTMLEAVRATGIERNQMGKSLRACVVSFANSQEKFKNPRLCGCVFFWQRDLGVGVTTHEITHAALTWARRRKLDLLKDEEKFCSVVENLNRQLVNRCYDWNIYKAN